jgi:hypothetical protein
MILVLGLLPFFVVLISALILGNAGRNWQEKITLFFCSPQDVERDSVNLLNILRVAFWVSLVLSSWLMGKTTGLV